MTIPHSDFVGDENSGQGVYSSNTQSKVLEINLFGGLSARYLGRRLRLGKKQGALLAYLALSHDGKVNRERFVGLLWSEHPATKAKRNLRQVLKNLRDQLLSVGFDGLDTHDANQLYLPAGRFRLDVREALESVTSLKPLVFLLEQKNIHESLLLDFEGLDPEFDSWIVLQRHAVRDRLSLKLENALSEATGNKIKNLASALHNLDPSNEVAVRALMRQHASENNFSGALRVYKDLNLLLDDEYGMDPTSETEDLVVNIKLSESEPSDTTAYAARSVALRLNEVAPELIVEKFNTELIPEDQVYVANGFRHDLMASLARFRDWRVVEQTFQVDASGNETRMFSSYVVRAQTYMDTSILHLVFTVIDTSNASIIWSEKYVLQMESWLVTQTQIIRKLAVSLNINISADRLKSIWNHRELPAALHDRWLLGQSHLFRWKPESSSRAEKIFRTISTEAPDFAPAYSSLVQIENSRHLVFPGLRRKEADDQSTIVLARKAVQIDPLDSKAHLSMAWSLCLGGRFEEALRYFDSATELNENDPWTIISTAQGYSFCAQYQRAKLLVEEANELGLSFNQLHCAYQVGTKFLYGDYQGAVDSAESAGDVISNVRAWKTAALAHLELFDSAIEEGQKFLAVNRSNWHGSKANPHDEEIVDWLLHCFPIRSGDKWDLLRAGLEKAQLPIAASVRAPH